MRRDLLELMEAALRQIEVTSPPLQWDRTLLLNNTGSLKARVRGEPPVSTDRGFHLLLLSEAGEPEYYCKCRPRNPDGSDRRAARFLRRFQKDPDTRSIVPRQGHAHNRRIDVQVAGFVRAPRMDKVLEGLDERAFHELVKNVQSAALRLSRTALRVKGSSAQQVDLVQESDPLLRDLPQLGVATEVGNLLRRGLAQVGDVPPFPQHRDLWPNNVFAHEDGGCTIVDFDDFGVVRVPLHDAFHLLRTSTAGAGRMESRLWFEHLQVGDTIVAEIIRDAGRELGLTTRQVGGCLLYYFLDIAVATFRRGGPETFWGQFRDELPAVAAFLSQHRDISALGELVS